jgi:pantoate--beta-alanine ligase
MGALHDGHRAPLRRARELAGADGTVVVSVFVNPLQFGEAADLDRYPRTLDADMEIIGDEGGDIVFAPAVAEMYPRSQRIFVDPGPLGNVLEGEFRPGHFAGVLTVVLKLFNLVRPDAAVFGDKDAQQLALVRQMTEDFALPIRIEPVPTVRGADGLALSSRNKFLSSSERAVARALPDALFAGSKVAGDGPEAVLAEAQAVLSRSGLAEGALHPGALHPGALHPEYVELVSADRFTPVTQNYRGTALLLVAARVGQVRLIDNVRIEFDAASD